MIRNIAWKTLGLLLLIAGGAGLLAWLLLATLAPSLRILFRVGAAVMIAALCPILAALARARLQREVAEGLRTAGSATPFQANRQRQEKLRGESAKALMAEHNRIARDVESTIIALGYRRADARRVIAIARHQHRVCSHEELLDFARKRLSTERAHITEVTETRTLGGYSMEPKRRSHNGGC